MTDQPSIHRTENLLRHRAWLLALARHLVHDEHLAEDLVQDTWVAALRRPPEDRNASRGWLATVLRNLASKARRSGGRRRRRESGAAAPEATPSVDELCAEAESQRRLTGVVLELEHHYKAVILLRYFEGMPVADVAARLNVPLETARTRIRRALARLRERLADDEERRHAGLFAGLIAMVNRRESPPAVPSTVGAVVTGGLVIMSKTKLVIGTAAALLVLSSKSNSRCKAR